ncbi:hypothetical protein WMY93_004038 [Mugilogobius chulae]|uniref:Uncharacterized protein n=1 Tax=Mugilogobius chulae TaxID=88201 RepID=A0AAW0PMN1_9GOBI
MSTHRRSEEPAEVLALVLNPTSRSSPEADQGDRAASQMVWNSLECLEKILGKGDGERGVSGLGLNDQPVPKRFDKELYEDVRLRTQSARHKERNSKKFRTKILTLAVSLRTR